MSGFTVTPGLDHLKDQYLREMSQDWTVLKSLINNGYQDLARHAHGMAGKCAMMGDLALAKVLYSLERDALADRKDDVAAALIEAEVILTDRCP